jgi:hypothetical protein
MGTMLKEYSLTQRSHAAACAKAAKLYPDARHVTGRLFEVDSLEKPTDVVVDDDGVWPCVFIGDEEERWGAVIVRERRYFPPKPEHLVRTLAEDPRGLALLLALIKSGRGASAALDSIGARLSGGEQEGRG